MKHLNFIYANNFRNIGDGELDLTPFEEFLTKNPTNEKVVTLLNKVRPPLSEQVIKDYFEKDENGKKLSQSRFDARVNSAVKTHDEKFAKEKLPSLIETEREKIRKELDVKETPEQKMLREQTERIDKLEKDNQRKDIKAEALQQMTKAKLPFADQIDTFLSDNLDDTLRKINAFAETFNTAVSAAAKELMKTENGWQPGDRQGNPVPLETQLDAARKANNLLEQIRLTDLIAAEANKKKS